MKKCINCNLPEDYPGIKFDVNGICNFCSFHKEHIKETLKDTKLLKNIFMEQIENAKRKAKENQAKYDCIVGFSGGKDSTYIIYQLKYKYGMRVLAYTFDNGFSTEYANENIQNTLLKLNVDYIKISMQESALRESYTFCSNILKNICVACFHFIHYYAHMLAYQHKIPLIVNGRTRGQVFQSVACNDRMEPFELSNNLKDFECRMFGDLVEKFDELGIFEYLPEAEATSLSYFVYHDISEEDTMAFLEKELDWKRPMHIHEDCWAHNVAENMFLKTKKYPVRTSELAYLVRSGEMTKEKMEHTLQTDSQQYSYVDEELRKRFDDRIKKIN